MKRAQVTLFPAATSLVLLYSQHLSRGSELLRVHSLDAHTPWRAGGQPPAGTHRPAQITREAFRHGDAEEGPILLDGEGAGIAVQQQPQHVAHAVRLQDIQNSGNRLREPEASDDMPEGRSGTNTLELLGLEWDSRVGSRDATGMRLGCDSEVPFWPQERLFLIGPLPGDDRGHKTPYASITR